MRAPFSSTILPLTALVAGWLGGRQYWNQSASGELSLSGTASSQADGNSSSAKALAPTKPPVSQTAIAAAVKAAKDAHSENAIRDAARRMALEPPPALSAFLDAAADSETVRAALLQDAVYWAFCRNAAAGLAQLSAVSDPKAAAAIASKALHFFPPKDLPVVLKWYQSLPATAEVSQLRFAALKEIQPVLRRKDFAQAAALTSAMPCPTGQDFTRRQEVMTNLLLSFEGSPEQTESQLSLFPAGDREYLKNQLSERDFRMLSNADRESAVPALGALPAAEAPGRATNFFKDWAENDPIRAALAISQVPESARSPDLYSTFASSWAKGNVAQASAWVDTLPPGPDREAASRGLVNGLSQHYPSEALTWAASLHDEEERARLMSTVIEKTTPEKRATLLPAIESLNLPAGEKATLRNALHSKP
jgi:hypothetical protein